MFGVSSILGNTKKILEDIEVLTMLVVDEYLGLGSDKKFDAYLKRHWKA